MVKGPPPAAVRGTREGGVPVPHRYRLVAGLAALAATAACQQPRDAELSADLRRDLELASAHTVELAPRPSHGGVVSAIEQTPGAAAARVAPAPRRQSAVAVARRPAAPRPAPSAPEAPAPRDVTAPSPAPAPAPVVAETPAAESPAPSPTVGAGRPSAPVQGPGPAPRGGWKTVGEVIRDAPFPIKP